MPRMLDTATGEVVDVGSGEVESGWQSGSYEFVPGEVYALKDDQGREYKYAGADAADAMIEFGYRPPTAKETIEGIREDVLEEQYGSAAAQAQAGGEALLRGATLGASDVAFRAGGASAEGLRERKERNSKTALTGEIVGAVAPALLSGGAGAAGRFAPSGAIDAAGAALSKRIGGGFTGAAARGAAEGAAFGAGEGVSELALSDDPVTLERAASVISSKALYGGLTGGAVGIFGKAAEKGLGRASKLVNERRAAAADVPTDGAKFADELEAYTKSKNPAFLVARKDAEDGAQAVFARNQAQMNKALDAREILARNPRRMEVALGEERQALRALISEGEESMLERLRADDAKIASKVEERIEKALAGKKAKEVILPKGELATAYRDAIGIAGRGKLKLTPEKATEFVDLLKSGQLDAVRSEAYQQIPGLLARNEALDAAIVSMSKNGGTLADQATGAAKTYAAGAMLGMLPGGPVGAIGAMFAPKVVDKLADLVQGRLSKAAAEAADRSSAALSAAFEAGRKSAVKASIPTASKVLRGTSFGTAPRQATEAASKSSGLVASYNERAEEIRSQVALADDGSIRMTPGARAEVAKRLDGVRAADPMLADRIETQAARRIEFLASKLPKTPDAYAYAIGPKKWRPSDMQVRKFARYVAAVEDPTGIVERAAAGRVSPEDAEVMRDVYPEQLADIRREVIERAGELRESLPYQKRLALSVLTGVPLDPSMSPRVIATLQAQFATEPETNGGMAPPKAKPAFGSISKPDATAAQEHAG